MTDLRSVKERYLKWVIVIAVILMAAGITLLVLFPDGGIVYIVGGTFIQIGITLMIIDLFISRIGSKLLQKQINADFREVLGIENPQSRLFPELIRLIRQHPYHVLSFNSINTLYYDNKNRNKKYNMLFVEESTIAVNAVEDNTQYHFFRGTSTGVNAITQLKEVSINGFLLDIKKDIIFCENKEENKLECIVKHPMKKGKVYVFKIKYKSSVCMSDLNKKGISEDYMVNQFIELTNKIRVVWNFPFEIKDYTFLVKKTDVCRREDFLKPKLQKKSIIIEEQNLNNGDQIIIIYRKPLLFKNPPKNL